ncbi:MAG: Mur ligase domain-containing protein, partial [Rhodosalinus sp.]
MARGTTSGAKSLSELGLTARGGGRIEVSGLSVDSREAAAGHLFAAMPGTRVHGARFVDQALD